MRLLLFALIVLVPLSVVSLLTGVSHMSLAALLAGDAHSAMILTQSRVPRTVALFFAGSGMAVAGTIMQMLTRNRFVDPTTTGTVESAGLGILAVLLVAPGLPVFAKMLVAAVFALAGTLLFLAILRRIPLRSALMVPLVGIMLGGVVSAVTTFFAYRYNMQQSLGAWMTGDFSSVLRGRYELLWFAAAMTVVAYIAADRFTVAGLGEALATNLGLDYDRILALGIGIVSMVSASVVVSVGMVPFLGLIVPNVVSMLMGDALRRTLPWIAAAGAALALAGDIVGRVVNAPYEIPVGTVLGVFGSGFFLYLLLKRQSHAA